jgi:hypothetical protein
VSNKNALTEAVGWLAWPLCAHHHLAVFDLLDFQSVDGCHSGNENSSLWAVGVLVDGQHEVLGVWSKPSCDDEWKEVFEDLKVRGVEKIRFVVGGESPAIASVVRGIFPTASLLPAGSLESTLPSLPHRYRRAFLRGEIAMQRLQRLAVRAVRRHDIFSSALEARAFVAGVLKRAELSIEWDASHADAVFRASSATGRGKRSRADAVGL